jgi:hypothetical protein
MIRIQTASITSIERICHMLHGDEEASVWKETDNDGFKILPQGMMTGMPQNPAVFKLNTCIYRRKVSIN